jgi:hypothetical protein
MVNIQAAAYFVFVSKMKKVIKKKIGCLPWENALGQLTQNNRTSGPKVWNDKRLGQNYVKGYGTFHHYMQNIFYCTQFLY